MTEKAPTTTAVVNGHTLTVVPAEHIHRTEKAYLAVGENACWLCGKKTSQKTLWWIHMSVNCDLLPMGTGLDFGSESQGCFPIGSECRKQFAPEFSSRMLD